MLAGRERTTTRLVATECFKTPCTTHGRSAFYACDSNHQTFFTCRWLRDEATGLVTNKVYADGKGPRYDYTPDGRLATRTWARGIVTTYSYDDNGSLTNTVYSDVTPTISLAYNRAGRQTRAEDAAGVTTFLYDDFGAVTNETVVGVAGTNTIVRHWDSLGRSLGYSLAGRDDPIAPHRQSTLAYDPATGRLATMLTNGSDTPFTWSYLAGSDLKSSLAYPNGLTASWAYDANGQLLQVKNAFPTNTISQYDYAYDVGGRRINVSKSGSAFDHGDTISYGYNSRSELTNAVAAIDSDYRYAYDFDDIGNRITSLDLGTNRTYTANNLNQYTLVGRGDPTAPEEEFTPQFDDDGNQTLIKTATGIWSVTYNGENRPVLWTCGTTNITMKFDRMGRRVEYLETTGGPLSSAAVTNAHHRFVYNGYLCVQRLDATNDNAADLLVVWDLTEPVATRPLWMQRVSGTYNFFYFHDGNKNVSDVVSYQAARGVPAHYEYAPFGTVTEVVTNTAVTAFGVAEANPWRFSSEYADDALGLVYYNYRHYNVADGRWSSRDPWSGSGDLREYGFAAFFKTDALGLKELSFFAISYYDNWWEDRAMYLSYYMTDDPKIVVASTNILSTVIKMQMDECDCIKKLVVVGHGDSQHLYGPNDSDIMVSMKIGPTTLTEFRGDSLSMKNGTYNQISTYFSSFKYCESCEIELQSCYLGRSPYLRQRLEDATGCDVKLYEWAFLPLFGNDKLDEFINTKLLPAIFTPPVVHPQFGFGM